MTSVAFIKRLIVTIILLMIGSGVYAQLNSIGGDGLSREGETKTYSYTTNQFLFISPKWTMTNGQVISSSLSANKLVATVIVRWDTRGNGTLTLKDKTTLIGTKAVTVVGNCANVSLPNGRLDYFALTGNQQQVSLTPGVGATTILWVNLDLLFQSIDYTGTSRVLTASGGITSYGVMSYNPTDFCASPMIELRIHPLSTVAALEVKKEVVRIQGVTQQDQISALTIDQKFTGSVYVDGLSRPIQQVARQASVDGFDVVQPTFYNAAGLAQKAFLPYVSGTTTGGYQTNSQVAQAAFYNTAGDNIANDPYPFSEVVLENSPLARIKERGGVGEHWQPGSTHTQRIEYKLNDANEVRKLNSDGSSTTFFPADALSKTIVYNENGHQTITFVDQNGRTLLVKRQQDQTNFLETYFIYDDLDRLLYTISPKGVVELKNAGWSFTNVKINYTYQYLYDKRGRLVEKKVPGQSSMFYIYDRMNRLVLVQDGKLRTQKKWLFNKYDRKGRVVFQGLYLDTDANRQTRATMQSYVDAFYTPTHVPFSEANRFERRGSTLEGYTNVSFPVSNFGGSALELWSVMYYDNHDFDFDVNKTPDFLYTSQGLANEATPGSTYGLPTGGKQKILNTTSWLVSYVFYDQYGRVIQVRSNNHLNLAGKDNLITVVYDYEGKKLQTKSYHNAGPGREATVLNTFNYYPNGMLKEVWQKNNMESDQLLAQYEYNKLGQLVDKKLHMNGADFLQSVDYRYTIKGWLSSINNSKLTSDGILNNDTDDYFGIELMYNDTLAGLGGTPRYNGDVSTTRWKGPDGGGSGSENQSAYIFEYDMTNQLKSASSRMGDGTAWTKEVGALDESMIYDQNGNVTSLQRKQRHYQLVGGLPGHVGQTVDNLTYTYNTALGDQLLKITDASSELGFNNGDSDAAIDFTYDPEGNITKDFNKGISALTYNVLGKVETITFTDGRMLKYEYTAGGAKLTMKAYPAGSSTPNLTTDYVNGFQYENQTLAFFPSPEGRVVKKGSTLEYQYAIADHQGNTRVVFGSTNPTLPAHLASFENIIADEQNFQNVNASNRVSKFGANETAGGSYSMRMNNTYPTGPAKSLKVFPGDVVDAGVYAYFEGTSGFGGVNQSLSTLISSVAAALTAGLPPPDATAVTNGVNSAFTIYSPSGNLGNSRPTAHLNYIYLDKNYNVIDMGALAVPVNANGSRRQMQFPPYHITEVGFFYVYLSYEGEGSNWVYFDDLRITHTQTNIIQYNEYYTFGMLSPKSWTRDDASNNYLYNQGGELNTTTGIYDLFFRNYDPATGRFFQVDPKAMMDPFTSAYVYAGNNPVSWNDPLGDIKVAVEPPPENNQMVGSFLWTYGRLGGGSWGGSGGGGGGGFSAMQDYTNGLMTEERGMDWNMLLMQRNEFKDYYGIDLNTPEGKAEAAKQMGTTVYSNGEFVDKYWQLVEWQGGFHIEFRIEAAFTGRPSGQQGDANLFHYFTDETKAIQFMLDMQNRDEKEVSAMMVRNSRGMNMIIVQPWAGNSKHRSNSASAGVYPGEGYKRMVLKGIEYMILASIHTHPDNGQGAYQGPSGPSNSYHGGDGDLGYYREANGINMFIIGVTEVSKLNPQYPFRSTVWSDTNSSYNVGNRHKIGSTTGLINGDYSLFNFLGK